MSGFELLDRRIQRWIYEQGWGELRDIQERTIPILIEGKRDVIVAASTASGKTEAAFLPILSNLLRDEEELGCVLYVSPIKALINDQWGRLDGLCESLDFPVTPWHGDIASNRKQRFIKSPRGALLITPESLEALFVNRGPTLRHLFRGLRYVVIDELHGFIGIERGRQLQSLLNRIELVIERHVPRVGLSATLGDMNMAKHFLRPGHSGDVEEIISTESRVSIKVGLKGFIHKRPSDTKPKSDPLDCNAAVATHLYETMRGRNNLVFPNTRGRVEEFADRLRRKCEDDGIPNEFWPHHGLLAKALRETVESTLKEGTRATTAIATSTLELGVDIGSVYSVAQIGCPPSVSALRQRLGRSGRRSGESSILRAYEIELEIDLKSGISTRLRENLLQSLAMISLMLQKWCEPPAPEAVHGSTLVQQILSIIAEKSGSTEIQLWRALCDTGPFNKIGKSEFLDLLRHMRDKDLIMQDPSGLILHGELGEQFVNHYEFYVAFQTEEEYSIESAGTVIGKTPVSTALVPDQAIIFAGRRWRVLDIDDEQLRIVVSPDHGGSAIIYQGTGSRIHDRVREEMLRILLSDQQYSFLDDQAAQLLHEARAFAAENDMGLLGLRHVRGEVALVTWRGDWVNDALVAMLGKYGLRPCNEGFGITFEGANESEIVEKIKLALIDLAQSGVPDPVQLLNGHKNIAVEKWDWALPPSLLCRSYATSNLDLLGAYEFVRMIVPPNKQADLQSLPDEKSTTLNTLLS